MSPFNVDIKIMNQFPDARIPVRAHDTDVAYDLFSCVSCAVQPGKAINIPCGFRIAMPENIWARIVARSSTRPLHNLLVVEGIIDPGYRGDISYVVHSFNEETFFVQAGMRLAQMIFHEKIDVTFTEQDVLPYSERGFGGYGSTGR